MKKFLFAIPLIINGLACQSQPSEDGLSISISGKTKSTVMGKVYWERINDRGIAMRLDSLDMKGGNTFEINKKIPEPGIYQINIANRQVVGLLLDGGEKLTITADAFDGQPNTFMVEGSLPMAQFNAVAAEAQKFRNTQIELQNQFDAAIQKKDEKKKKELQNKYQTSETAYFEKIKPMVAQMGTSMAGLVAMNNFINIEKEYEMYQNLANRLEKEGKKHFFANMFLQQVKGKSSGKIGSDAPDFQLVDLSGKTVKLSELRGKTVILDFWATWCGPCIMSFPGMKMAIEKYKNNTDVVFLFVDTYERVSTDEWKNHVSNFVAQRNFNNLPIILDIGSQTAGNYGVEGIPAKFCIDKDGKIKYKSTGYLGSNDKILEEITHWVEGK
jgi:thiol-disulfide isomerase/thioredoxin